VEPTDTPTFAVAAITLLIVAALASILPSLRIARIDPALTLRDQ
jgi:ABC-type lipoprotein release transport system permease subunit